MVVEKYLPRRAAVHQVSNVRWNHKDAGGIRASLERTLDVERFTRRYFDECGREAPCFIRRAARRPPQSGPAPPPGFHPPYSGMRSRLYLNAESCSLNHCLSSRVSSAGGRAQKPNRLTGG